MWQTIEGVGRLPVEGDGVLRGGAGLCLGKRGLTSRWEDARKDPLLRAGLTGVLRGVIQRAKSVQALPETDPGSGSGAAGRRMLQR